MRKIFINIIIAFSYISSAYAFESFVIKDIKVQGIQRVSIDAVLQNLSVAVGDKIDEKLSNSVIKDLFKTGFFKEVSLERDGNILIVKVIERPSIGKLELTGIKNKEKVIKILKDKNIAEGLIYDPNALALAIKEIEQHFLLQSHYGVKVNYTITNESRNRINLKIDIYKGDIAKIKEIKIIGNQFFSEKQLKAELYHKPTNLFSFFTKSDRYSKEKLDADLEKLRSFYLDRGYINFQIESTQVSLTPDKKGIYLTIIIKEGDKYKLGKIALELENSPKIEINKAELKKIIDDKLSVGDVFSRAATLEVKDKLQQKLGDHGYSKAEIRIHTIMDDKNHQVELQYSIDIFKRILVRRINFEGNNLVEDIVLRRGVEQLESSWISTKKVQSGKQYLLREGYASTVDVQTKEVLGKDDQVDINYKIEEARNAEFSAALAYSAVEKLHYNIGVNYRNFLGTGRDVNVLFEHGKVSETYSFGYFNPYFTESGIGLGFSLHKNKRNLSKSSSIFDYAVDSVGGAVSWQFRLSQYNYLKLGIEYDNLHLKLQRDAAPLEAIKFIDHYGNKLKFNEYVAVLSLIHNSLDAYLFPTKGFSQIASVKLAIPPSGVKYYNTEYEISWFRPLSKTFVLNLRGNAGYANSYSSSVYPFYKNFYLGGPDTIRGFEVYSLGPKSSNGDPFGGNMLVMGRMQLIFPPPISALEKPMRLALFLDGGQVYDTHNKLDKFGNSRNPNSLRYSTGISLNWNTPLGLPVVISLARPLNKKAGDQLEVFSINIGTQF